MAQVPEEDPCLLGNDSEGTAFTRYDNSFGQEATMGNLRKFGIITATVLAVAGTSVALSSSADARWGGWHGGGWHGGHSGWGWGGFGVGLGTGLLVGAATSPYYGGYYGYSGYDGGPYDYGYYPDYAYDYEYSSPDYAYYDEPYDSRYYGYGGPSVGYRYSNYRRPYYRNGDYYTRTHSYRSGSYPRIESRDRATHARATRASGSYARANSDETLQPRHVRTSTTHHRVHRE
jgi:hypothetical protein